MEVSAIAELDSHAIVGGRAVEAFGMAETAEFFTVLSDTLYRDKKRAVAREVICNAWDAHAMVGKTDTPIRIALNDHELVITDFGPGIPHDKMRTVYCVYGASTKVKDANQTGGFGLGCKAPFAYTDFFTVTNSHAGVRSVYAISRGGADTDGKPSIRTMMSGPTEESGITVAIPINTPADAAEFMSNIRAVVKQGGVLALLNESNSEMPCFDIEAIKKLGFGVIAETPEFKESPVYVLYGAVLYPLTTTNAALMAKVGLIKSAIEKDSVLILAAPPNSIGVTPAREALSYSEKTTDALSALLDGVLAKLRSRHKPMMMQIMEKDLADNMRRHSINPREPYNNHSLSVRDVVTDLDQIVMRSLRSHAGEQLTYLDRIRLTAKIAQKKFRDDRRIFRRFMVPRADGHSTAWGRRDTDAFSREYFARERRPFLRLLAKAGVLQSSYFFRVFEGLNSLRSEPVPIPRQVPGQITKTLLIGPSRKKIGEHLTDEIECEGLFIGIVLPRPLSGQIDKIKALAEHYGIETVVTEYPERKKAEKQAPKTKFFGLCDVPKDWSWQPDLATVEQPAFYIKATGLESNMKLHFVVRNHLDRQALDAAYPNTVIIRTAKDEEKLKKMKVPSLGDAILADLRKLGKSREVQYALMREEKRFIKNRYYYDKMSEAAVDMAQTSDEVSKLLFPDRAPAGANGAKLRFLLGIKTAVMTNREGQSPIEGSLYEWLQEFLTIVADIRKNADATFSHLIITAQQAEQKFSYLTHLDHNVSSPTRVRIACDLIRFLQRKTRKSTLTEPLKEAA